jgi:tetratricopeptide (TPR) repeat protein
MMQILRNKLVQWTRACLAILCVSVWVAAQITPTKEPNLKRFEKIIEAGDLVGAERDLFNYLIANPKDANGFVLMAKLRLRQNRLNEARSLSNRALALEPKLLSAKLILAQTQFHLGEKQEALAVLAGISDADITGPSSRLSIVQTYALIGDCRSAMAAVDKLPVTIKNGEALPTRAACFIEMRDRKGIDSLIPIARSQARIDPTLVIKFARALSQRGLHGDVAALLRPIVLSSPKNVDALLLLAKSEIFIKEIPNAKARLAQAQKIRPDSAELFFVRSFLESEQGNYTAALESLERSLAADPNSIEVMTQFVVLGMRANQAGKSVRAAERLMELRPDDPEFVYLHGAASLQNNNLQKAEASLTRFLKERPRDSLGCLALGITFASQADKAAEARQQLQLCLEIDPNNYEASYQLGLSHKTQGDAAKAIEYYERTLRLYPNHVSGLRDLGAVYMETGDEAKARPILEKAALLSPNDPDIHFQMSRLYNIIGERALGKKHLEIFQKLKTPKKDGM